MRLNIASGMAVRFEPGQQRTVELVDIGGDRQIYGFRGLIWALSTWIWPPWTDAYAETFGPTGDPRLADTER